jgi:predicted MFS family arabinose efflux permease
MGWEGNPTILLGLVVGGAGVGNTIGTLIGSAASSRRPEKVVIGVLVLDVAVLATVGVFFTWWTAVVLGVTVGICQSLGKLSLDALIQRDVAERVRTSMFARSETLLQLSWVIGGLIGIGLFTVDATPRIGLLVTAVILVAWLAFVLSRANGRTSGEDGREPDEHGYRQHRGDRDTVPGQ